MDARYVTAGSPRLAEGYAGCSRLTPGIPSRGRCFGATRHARRRPRHATSSRRRPCPVSRPASRGAGRQLDRSCHRLPRHCIRLLDRRRTTIGRANLDGTGVEPELHHRRQHPRRRRGRRRARLLDQRIGDGHDRPRQPRRHGRQPELHRRAERPVRRGGRRRARLLGQRDRRARSAAPTSTARASTRTSSPAPRLPDGVAVDAAHVYWAELDAATRSGAPTSTARASTRASSPARRPDGVAVDAAHVYWANLSTDAIGRANLDGTGVNQSFITGANPVGVAVDAAHVYWANADAARSGAPTSTARREPELHHRREATPRGIAVDGLSSTISASARRRGTRRREPRS